MNVQTLTDQIQAEGLSLKAHYSSGRFICVIRNTDGVSVAAASEKQLDTAVTVALNKLDATESASEPVEIVLS